MREEEKELFKNTCTEAIGRLEALEELCFYARQEDELEVNLADAVKLIGIADRTAKVIAEHFNEFLLEHGVHVDTSNPEEEKEAC